MRYFYIPNWEDLQHYKDRTPPWIKLYNQMLDDYAFGCLQDASKAHLLSIYMLASRTGNRLPYDARWLANKISASDPVDLDALLDAGFLVLEGAPIESERPESRAPQTEEEDCSNVLALRTQSACPEQSRAEGEGEAETEQNTPRAHAREASDADPPDDDDEPLTTEEKIQAVFEYWRWRMAKPRAKLTAERRKKIKARVREKFTMEDFKLAIDAVSRSNFHNGENDKGNVYNDLTMICRSGEKLEWYRDDLHQKTPRRPGEESITEFRERAAAQAERIMASGMLDDLNDGETSTGAAQGDGATYEH